MSGTGGSNTFVNNGFPMYREDDCTPESYHPHRKTAFNSVCKLPKSTNQECLDTNLVTTGRFSLAPRQDNGTMMELGNPLVWKILILLGMCRPQILMKIPVL